MDKLLAPAFTIDESVELKEVPTTGEEFLKKVIAERKSYPEYVYVKRPQKTKQNIFIEEPPTAALAPPTVKPTVEWQNIQLSDFYSMRIHVIRLSLERAQLNHPTLPDIDQIVMRTSFIKTNKPNLKLMLAFKQKNLDECLEVILDMLDDIPPGEGMDVNIGEWIYAILIRQSNPVLPETSCLLRNLARKCAEIRSHLDVNNEKSVDLAAPLNLFICIVARYYRELDLAD